MYSVVLEGFEGSIKVRGRTVTNLRYADDVALLAGSAITRIIEQNSSGKQRTGIKVDIFIE